MHEFTEIRMTGGVSYITQRYSKGNKSYNKSELSKRIIYLDINNLKG